MTLTAPSPPPDRTARSPRADRRPMTLRRFLRKYLVGIIAILVSIVVFIVPFAFIFLTAAKNPQEAVAARVLAAPAGLDALGEPRRRCSQTRDYILVRAFVQQHDPHRRRASRSWWCFAAMVGYVLQRRKSRWNAVINFFVLAGLIVPPAVVPTIWVLQGLGLFKTHAGHDPHRGHLRPLVLHPAVPCVRLDDPAGARRGGDHRRRRARCGCSSRVVLPLLQARDRHGHRRAGRRRVQRLHRTRCTSCPATRTRRCSSTLYNFRARTSASGTCCSWTSCSSRSRR